MERLEHGLRLSHGSGLFSPTFVLGSDRNLSLGLFLPSRTCVAIV